MTINKSRVNISILRRDTLWLLVERVNLGLVISPNRSGAGIAAAGNHDDILCTAAAAGNVRAHAIEELSRAKTGVDLHAAAHAPV